MKKGMLVLLAAVAVASVLGCTSARGRFRLTWSVTIDGLAAACADVGGTTVEIISTDQDTGEGFSDLFDCSRLSGVTRGLPAGDYSIVVRLEDNAGHTLSQIGPINGSAFSGDTTDVGHFEFQFVYPKARLFVHMGSAQVTGGNCQPTNPGNGAGVALEEIDIRSGNQCMDAAITGITNESNQPDTGATCEQLLCQPVTARHVISGLPTGTYTIQGYGFKGATSGTPAVCYISQPMNFTISSADVDLGTIFAPFDDSLDTQGVCNATKPEEAL